MDEATLPSVIGALTDAAASRPAFDLTVHGLGAFPSTTRPRVLWAGVCDGARAVERAAAAVEEALAAFGFEREARPFSAHVTLGRLRTPRRDPGLTEALGAGGDREFGRAHADHLSLMRSDLAPRGARHTELAACRLARAGAA